MSFSFSCSPPPPPLSLPLQRSPASRRFHPFFASFASIFFSPCMSCRLVAFFLAFSFYALAPPQFFHLNVSLAPLCSSSFARQVRFVPPPKFPPLCVFAFPFSFFRDATSIVKRGGLSPLLALVLPSPMSNCRFLQAPAVLRLLHSPAG